MPGIMDSFLPVLQLLLPADLFVYGFDLPSAADLVLVIFTIAYMPFQVGDGNAAENKRLEAKDSLAFFMTTLDDKPAARSSTP